MLRHIAIIMDGNGRWAKARRLPRMAGHRRGVDAIRRIVYACGERSIEVLTLFAFSSENWRRPQREVGNLMSLFTASIRNELDKLDENDVRLRFIGGRSRFSSELAQTITAAEARTQDNAGLTLQIAADYGGRWDIVDTARQLAQAVAAGELAPDEIDERLFNQHISTAASGEPDLFIRTGGDFRISNFLLWQLAYTELYFTSTLWPEFDESSLDQAIADYRSRQRRFGKTGEQVGEVVHAKQQTG